MFNTSYIFLKNKNYNKVFHSLYFEINVTQPDSLERTVDGDEYISLILTEGIFPF